MAEFSLRACLGKQPLSSLQIMGRIWVLVGCWTESLSFLLAVGQMSPSCPCHTAFSTEQLPTWHQASAKPARVRISLRGGGYNLCIVIMEGTPHHLCCVLWVTNKSLLTSPRRERHELPEVGAWVPRSIRRVDNVFLGWISRVKFQGLKSLWFSLVTVSPYSQKN